MCYYICVTDNIIQYKGDQAIGNEDSRYGNRGNNKDFRKKKKQCSL